MRIPVYERACPGPDRLGLKCYLAWGRGGGWGGELLAQRSAAQRSAAQRNIIRNTTLHRLPVTVWRSGSLDAAAYL